MAWGRVLEVCVSFQLQVCCVLSCWGVRGFSPSESRASRLEEPILLAAGRGDVRKDPERPNALNCREDALQQAGRESKRIIHSAYN